MIKESDTAMIPLRGNVDAVLSQHWYLDDVSDVSDEKLVFADKTGVRLFPSINLFSDGNLLENPRSGMKMGKWTRTLNDGINTIQIMYDDGSARDYRIRELSLKKLTLSWQNDKDSLWIQLRSDGIAHQNQQYDPFHPVNNRWRVKPAEKESDEDIRSRVKDCIRFYALYYRDHIKRRKSVILFSGLPEIFTWYNGGLGLPDSNELDKSWVDCFYNKEQAKEGYRLLKDLITKYEFDWPTGTPGWHYRTFSVLEQMHEKI